MTERDTSVAGVTVRVVDPDTLPDVAVIVVEPVPVPLASPLEPAALLMEATALDDELQAAERVRSCFVLSENVPVAANCFVVPLAMLGFVGVTSTDTSVAGVTVRVVDPDTLPDAAVIVVEPVPDPLASPLEPVALLMAATAADEELQFAVVVRFCVVPSE